MKNNCAESNPRKDAGRLGMGEIRIMGGGGPPKSGIEFTGRSEGNTPAQ
jgi:hypothetical protein